MHNKKSASNFNFSKTLEKHQHPFLSVGLSAGMHVNISRIS